MKQNLNARDWGIFERANQKAANKWRAWLDAKDYPPATEGCILYDVQPIFIRTTIGRMIEFLDEHNKLIADEFGELKFEGIEPLARPKNTDRLCDALWEDVREKLEK